MCTICKTKVNKIDFKKVMSLLQHSEEERFTLKAAGLVRVGAHLLPAVNYLII